MIIITGANGALGRAVVENVLLRVGADQIGVSVRDPAQAEALAQRGVRVRRGDFTEPTTLPHAFEGASQVLLVSVNALGPEAVAQHGVAIAAARTAGAQRILYTSHIGARPDSPVAFAPDHAATEELLRDSGLPFTSLRNGFYANTAKMLLQQALATGTLVSPEDGPVNWTAPADLAEAAAVILTQDGVFEGPTPPLAASRAIDLDELAAIGSEVHGRKISHVTLSEGAYRDSLIAQGTPEQFAGFFLSMFAASRRGDFATDDLTLERLIGHPTTSVGDVLASDDAGDAH